MKNKNMENVKKSMCGILLQMAALAGFFIGKMWGAGLLIISILYAGIYTFSQIKKNAKLRLCEKCGAEFPKNYRVCPNCGNVCVKADTEKELAEVMEDEEERTPEETPEELERNFERIEEMNVEKALALDEDDIEGILMEKMQKDDRIEG